VCWVSRVCAFLEVFIFSLASVNVSRRFKPIYPPEKPVPKDTPLFRFVRVGDWVPVWDGKWHAVHGIYVTYGGEWVETEAKGWCQYIGADLNLPEWEWFQDISLPVYPVAFPGDRPVFRCRFRVVVKNEGGEKGPCILVWWDEDGEHDLSLGELAPGEEREVELVFDLNKAPPGGEFEGKPAWVIEIKLHNPLRDKYSPTGVYYDGGILLIVVPLRHAPLFRIVRPEVTPGTTTGYIGPPGEVKWSVLVENVGKGSGECQIVLSHGGWRAVSAPVLLGPGERKLLTFNVDLCRLGVNRRGRYEFAVTVNDLTVKAVDDAITCPVTIEVAEARLVGIAMCNLGGSICIPRDRLPSEIVARPGEEYAWVGFTVSGWEVIGKLVHRAGYVNPADIKIIVKIGDKTVAESHLGSAVEPCGNEVGNVGDVSFRMPEMEGEFEGALQLVNTKRCGLVDDEWRFRVRLTPDAPVLDLVNARGDFEASPGEEVEYWIELENKGKIEARGTAYLLRDNKIIASTDFTIGGGERKRVSIRFRAPEVANVTYTYSVVVLNWTSFRLECASTFMLTTRGGPTNLPTKLSILDVTFYDVETGAQVNKVIGGKVYDVSMILSLDKPLPREGELYMTCMVYDPDTGQWDYAKYVADNREKPFTGVRVATWEAGTDTKNITFRVEIPDLHLRERETEVKVRFLATLRY